MVTMATTEAAKICGLCKEVTLAILPRLHQEELLLELGRRNILVGETFKKESLVSKLWFIMIKEFQGTDRCVIPDPPTAASGTSCSSATEQRNMWVTLSNDLQELMETVTSTNTATNIVPVTSPTRSTNPTLTQPSTSVTMSSPQRLPILAQEVVVETTTVTSPRRSARLHTLETQASSSSVRNLRNIGETLEENTATKEGLGKGYLKRELRAVTVTRQSCSVGSNTVVTDLGAMRELVDEDGNDPNAEEEDDDEDGVSSDEDDAPLDDDDPDWQPDSPVEDRQPHSSSDIEASVSDKNSHAGTSEEVITVSQGEILTPPRHDGPTKSQQQGRSPIVKCPECDFTTASGHRLRQHKTCHDKTRIYACKKCEYRGRKKAHLQDHMKVHSGEQAYKCRECDFSSRLSSQLSLHMKKEHGAPGASGALCELCGYKAERLYMLKLHRYKHTGEKPYKCLLCAFTARDMPTLVRHSKVSHPGENCYKCAHCSHFAKTRSLLRKHERTHKAEHVHKSPTRPCPVSSNDRNKLVAQRARSNNKRQTSQQYSCPVCNHKTDLLCNMKEHMKTHGKVYKCDRCEFSANTYASLRQHIANHKKTEKYKCDKCDFTSKTKFVLLRHTKDHGDNPFQCQHCEFNANTQDDLSIHLGEHFDPSNAIICGLCGYVAKTEDRLEQHIAEHDAGLKMYKCDFHGCDFSSPDRQCFVRHVTSHDPSRQYPCKLCDYRAKRKIDLATHMRTHTGEKPLKCSKCPFATSLPPELKRHEAGHGRNFPNMCDICQFTARSKNSLAEHKKLHKGEALMEHPSIGKEGVEAHRCLHCDFKASDGHELYLHAMKHINDEDQEDDGDGDVEQEESNDKDDENS
ncbi:zinc finger protein 271-like isoform X1 [Branchiostoma floridae]|uniref:Zinc finger protein 271-like isoform X1 n=2 Tax=Branchiostoma floridae TaxID=7739 RepID=A0A9J7HNZ6_BRAFL|nr:zinc finger protein 271-like isoform X1 [Branchiostoma floridae]